MKRLTDVSLETKINGILIGIITIVVISISAFISYDSIYEYYDNAERLSLQSAKTISFLPSIVDGTELSKEEDIQTLANQFVFDNDLDFLIIKDIDGTIITHPDETMIGETEQYDRDIGAKLFGAYYTYYTGDYEEPSVISVAPIYAGDNFKVMEGIVKAGYFNSTINTIIFEKLSRLFALVVVFIVISMFISKLFSNYIKSETLGYEPKEITTILKNREKIFSSLDEGIVASDTAGNMTYINNSAYKFLSLSKNKDNREAMNIFQLLPNDLSELFQSDEETTERYFKTHLDGREMIILKKNLYEKDSIVGNIFIMRDMSEVAELSNKLTVVESLFDDLRAQSHEYKNKLHLISGLLEMSKFDKIREVLNDEISDFDIHNSNLTNIKEEHIKALLIAKMNKASEKKISFEIVEASELEENILSDKSLNSLIIIISNLVDNAMEAVSQIDHPKVTFYIGHFDGWLEIIIEDNGMGFKENDNILEKGYSTKGDKDERGYGLHNVITNINILDGYLDFFRDYGKTVFIVDIPFLEEGDMK